ncbi:hypothetical protein WN48_05465 [Eufriesea mexicana]|uniref:Uncharacterized protein n=1 Tax=Eufriesea mexicana TaxID=516756 RepID=A0A310SHL2_9HYME|nr:hypothetical protein WN48_05465 [Eufriesea mexicana]
MGAGLRYAQSAYVPHVLQNTHKTSNSTHSTQVQFVTLDSVGTFLNPYRLRKGGGRAIRA